LPSLLLKGRNSYELLPSLEIWFQSEGFETCILANRLDAKKKTGILSSLNVSIFLEDYSNECLARINGSIEICQKLIQHLTLLQPLPYKREVVPSGLIIKEREIIKIPCRYCGALILLTDSRCQNCGAILKG
jgi:hypothetical protein